MSQSFGFLSIKGVIADLRTSEGAEDFVGAGASQASGAAAAVGLAAEGLAGAAAGAAQFSSDIADKVTFFRCRVGGQLVTGRFGNIGFSDDDEVEIVGTKLSSEFLAYAVARPKDRSVWMHPHCSRGTGAYKRFTFKWIGLVAWVLIPLCFLALDFFTAEKGQQIPLWFALVQWLVFGVFFSAMFGFVASRFWRYAKLSDQIFTALELPEPKAVNLQRTLSAAMQSMTQAEKLKYHPMKRWVYRY